MDSKAPVEHVTGPVMLRDAIRSYQKHAGGVKWRPLTFIPPGDHSIEVILNKEATVLRHETAELLSRYLKACRMVRACHQSQRVCLYW